MRLVVLIFLIAAIVCSADEIDDLTAAGQLNKAYQLLLNTYKNSPDEPAYLFVKGLTEDSGENSAGYLKGFINKSPEGSRLADWARLYLGKYYLAQKLYVTARRNFEEVNEGSPFGIEASYLAAKCFLLAEEFELAADAFGAVVDRFENLEPPKDQNGIETYYHWSKLGLADALAAMGNYAQAESLYKQFLEREFESYLSAPALLGLAELSERQQKWIDSQNYLNIYNDRYGVSEKFISEETMIDTTTEFSSEYLAEPPVTIHGIQYFIQIGVFFNKDNATNLSKLYKNSGYKTRIENFIESGEEFHRILVGPYDSKQQAEFIKNRLEKAAKEKYLLIER
jgi:tetratricopeptide (TPR) repeat protein